MQFVAFNSRVVLWPAVRTKNKRGLREAVRLIHCHALRGGRPVARWGVEARVSRGGRCRGQVDNVRCVIPVPLYTPRSPLGVFFHGVLCERRGAVFLFFFFFAHVLHGRLDVYDICRLQ